MVKKINLSLLILALSHLILSGQDFSPDFGKISQEEIELTEYELDKDAEAVVLYDKAVSYFASTESSFDVVFERTTRIKILTDAGIKWAEVEILFYQEGDTYEKVSDIVAYSYNYENDIIIETPFNTANAYDEKISEFWNAKKFAIPNVKAGTIIEYKYKISSTYTFNLRDWKFQWKIPVVYSEYKVKMVPFYEYSWLLQGASKFDSQYSYVDHVTIRHFGTITFQDMVHKYVMKNVPAFDNEEFITSINDYIIKLDFQLAKINYPNGSSLDIITTWEDMNKELLKNKKFGKYIKKSLLSDKTYKIGEGS